MEQSAGDAAPRNVGRLVVRTNGGTSTVSSHAADWALLQQATINGCRLPMPSQSRDTLLGMRRVVPLLLTLALTFSLAACGRAGAGSASGGHHVVAKGFCALSAYALYRDVRAHRLGWAAFQAILAHHNCKQAFRRP